MKTGYLAFGWLLFGIVVALTIWTLATDPTQLSSFLLGATSFTLFGSLMRGGVSRAAR